MKKGFMFWQDDKDGNEVEQIIKSWRPLVKRLKRHDLDIQETATGNHVGKMIAVKCSEKMAEVIKKQMRLLHPEQKYVDTNVTTYSDGSAEWEEANGT